MYDYNIIISPETISSDLNKIIVSGQTVGVYSGMTFILSGGVNGTSLLSGLTIPILLTQTISDLGYYSPFDGNISQIDSVSNFIFSSTTTNPYEYFIYNTCNTNQAFLETSLFTVDWGDGSSVESFTGYTPSHKNHFYPTNTIQDYVITVTQRNRWGVTKIQKKISTPYTIRTSSNPLGTINFVSNTGSWSGTASSYNYIFTGDSDNRLSAQVSSGYTTVPFYVSGYSSSRLYDLSKYGSSLYSVGLPIYSNGEYYGQVNNFTPTYTAYTIQNVDYYDYADGKTIFFCLSSGFTEYNIVSQPMIKNEALLKVIDEPEIQTDVYVERGKNSAFERVQRLGEVANIGSLVNYGYGFFNVEKKI